MCDEGRLCPKMAGEEPVAESPMEDDSDARDRLGKFTQVESVSM